MTEMGSLEVYNHKDRKWVLYVPDIKKWEQYFVDVSTELVFPDHKGRYIIGNGINVFITHESSVRPEQT
jgi:hypothetical protein